MKEADGSIWRYQYYPASDVGGNHLLQAVIDPKGNMEEANQYQQVQVSGNSSNYDNHWRVSQQYRAGEAETHNLSYGSGGSGCTADPGWDSWADSHTTDTDGLNRTSYYGWDGQSNQITCVTGVAARGDVVYYFNRDWFGRPTAYWNNASTVATVLYTYGRDNLVTNPDGSQYIEAAVQGPTEVDMPRVQGSGGSTITVARKYKYYPSGDPRQDLVSQESDASVGLSGGTAMTSYTYSSDGSLTQLTRSGYSNGTPISVGTSLSFDSRGRLLAVAGPRTDITQKTTLSYFSDSDADLNRRGQLASVTDALGHVTNVANAASPFNTYSPYGIAASVMDPNGATIERTFDASGRVLSSDLVGVGTTAVAYDALGAVTSVTEPLGNSVQLGYNQQEKLQTVTRADSSGSQHEQATFGYNSMDEFISETLSQCTSPATSCSSWIAAYTRTLTINVLGRIVNITDGDGIVQGVGYIQGQNLPASVTLGGVTQGFTNDPLNVINGSHIDGVNASYFFDAQYNLSGMTYGTFFSNNIARDDLGRITKTTDNYFGSKTYQYDAAGNATAASYADGSSVVAAYDALNRVTAATFTKPGVPTETITYSYDDPTPGHYGIGRLSSVTDPSGQTNYTYEPHGMIATKTQTVNGSPYSYQYAYDQNGRLTSLSLASGATIGYGYDFADRPNSVTLGGSSLVTSAAYEPFGPLSSLQYANGVNQLWTYGTGYRMSKAVVDNSTATISSLEYARTTAGNVSKITDDLNSAYDQTIGYNAFNLTGDNTGSKLWGTGTFTEWEPYEGLASYKLGTSTGTLTYGTSSALPTSIQTSASGSLPVTTDAIGNATSIGGSSYSYSARQRLGAADGISYQYDASGHRVFASGAQGSRASLYVNGHLAEESGISASQPAFDYVWLGGMPIAEIASGTRYYIVSNHLGAPYMLTDGSGKVAWQADYAPFGNIYSLRTADLHQPLRLPGQEAEEFAVGNPNGASSLYYSGARWYSPSYGFYTQPDPLQNAMSLYGYAVMNPTNFIDPTGEGISGGISGGAQGELGFPFASAGGSVVVGQGVFVSDDGTVSGGSFSTYGRFGQIGPFVGGDPSQFSRLPFIGQLPIGGQGADVAAGVSAWVSNAQQVSDLEGPFCTLQGVLGFGSVQFSFTVESGVNKQGQWIWLVQGSPEGYGFGLGAGGASYVTTTSTAPSSWPFNASQVLESL